LSIELGSANKRYLLETLSQEWTKGGGRVNATVAASCVVTECTGMAFVGLLTVKGAKPVCLKHYEQLDGVLVA
jgi:hypothetical protein